MNIHISLQHRMMAALNQSTPVDVLVQLAADEDNRVRSSVAQNLNTPVDSLVTLAADRDEDIRQAVRDRNHPLVNMILAADALCT